MYMYIMVTIRMRWNENKYSSSR